MIIDEFVLLIQRRLRDESSRIWDKGVILDGINAAFSALCTTIPQAYTEHRDLTLVEGTEQEIDSDLHRLVHLIHNKCPATGDAKRAIVKADLSIMDKVSPQWRQDEVVGYVIHYLLNPIDESKFYVWPPASPNEVRGAEPTITSPPAVGGDGYPPNRTKYTLPTPTELIHAFPADPSQPMMQLASMESTEGNIMDIHVIDFTNFDSSPWPAATTIYISTEQFPQVSQVQAVTEGVGPVRMPANVGETYLRMEDIDYFLGLSKPYLVVRDRGQPLDSISGFVNATELAALKFVNTDVVNQSPGPTTYAGNLLDLVDDFGVADLWGNAVDDIINSGHSVSKRDAVYAGWNTTPLFDYVRVYNLSAGDRTRYDGNKIIVTNGATADTLEYVMKFDWPRLHGFNNPSPNYNVQGTSVWQITLQPDGATPGEVYYMTEDAVNDIAPYDFVPPTLGTYIDTDLSDKAAYNASLEAHRIWEATAPTVVRGMFTKTPHVLNTYGGPDVGDESASNGGATAPVEPVDPGPVSDGYPSNRVKYDLPVPTDLLHTHASSPYFQPTSTFGDPGKTMDIYVLDLTNFDSSSWGASTDIWMGVLGLSSVSGWQTHFDFQSTAQLPANVGNSYIKMEDVDHFVGLGKPYIAVRAIATTAVQIISGFVSNPDELKFVVTGATDTTPGGAAYTGDISSLVPDFGMLIGVNMTQTSGNLSNTGSSGADKDAQYAGWGSTDLFDYVVTKHSGVIGKVGLEGNALTIFDSVGSSLVYTMKFDWPRVQQYNTTNHPNNINPDALWQITLQPNGATPGEIYYMTNSPSAFVAPYDFVPPALDSYIDANAVSQAQIDAYNTAFAAYIAEVDGGIFLGNDVPFDVTHHLALQEFVLYYCLVRDCDNTANTGRSMLHWNNFFHLLGKRAASDLTVKTAEEDSE